ncbi:MAG: Tn3 family transposase [Nitrospirales bacterium]|nr:Tn3 family transposase [Nitrospira sp.]MDR4502733.1 Tn3 family transposase [Nitrospirales bacterium]
MPRMEVLSAVEREEFDSPPTFTFAQQQHYFDPSLDVIRTLKRQRTPTHQVYFLVSYGYFLATHRFYPSALFRESDIQYVTRIIGLDVQQLQLWSYVKPTQTRHRHLIRTLCQFRRCDHVARQYLTAEVQRLVKQHWAPRHLFVRLVEQLSAKRIEIPGSGYLSRLIATTMTQYRLMLARRLRAQLTPAMREGLAALLNPSVEPMGSARYRLGQLKRLSQSTKPTKVQIRLKDLEEMQTLYQLLTPVLPVLNLPQAGIIEYATITLKLDLFDLVRRTEPDRLLHLFTFAIHHYFRLHDNLVDVFLSVLPSLLSSVQREHMEHCYEKREAQSRSLTTLLTILETDVLTAFKTIKRIAESSTLSDRDKIQRIQTVFAARQTPQQQLVETMTPLKASVEEMRHQDAYYTVLERRSLRLQARLMPILKHLPWQGTDQALLAAIRYVKTPKGDWGREAPKRFLTATERKAVSPPAQAFRVSLYKALLFIHVQQGIKAGTLYLNQSYKYRALEDYLLSREQWQQHRQEYLKQAGLQAFTNPHTVLHTLETHLQRQYVTTNEHILAQQNAHVSQKADASFVVRTPAQPMVNTEALSTFFPGRQYIALTEILATVDRLTHFLSEFKHGHYQPRESRPPTRAFLAGVLGLGCGIGVRKLARISWHVQEGQVEHTVHWYFTPTTVRAANDRILQMVEQLPLPDIYRRSEDVLQTSSDGQKFEVPAESLNANFSYKYFGKGQGVSVYSFIDERHLLFYSTVLSAAERESAYVLDGLLYQDGLPSTIHSTNTHGYSELVFGAMHLLGFAYAPRIKNFQRQRLYAFKELRRHARYAAFALKPHGTINTDLICEHWDDILRFVATLKLRITTPSALFRRLNSYSAQHLLYRALKAFGQILKSMFLLRYFDEVELRQQITQQLNKVEQSHRFARALSVGTPREFLSVEKDEQEIEEGCKRLIKNAVTCWNYVYLSKRLMQTADPTHQHLFLEAIRHGSPISWQHVNLLGEYDFSDARLEDSVGIFPATWLTENQSWLREALER